MATEQTPDQKRRQAEVERINGKNLEPLHTDICRVFPTRTHMLAALTKGVIAAEVGVAFGAFSKQMFEHLQPVKLHLIDAWQGERYEAGKRRVEAHFAREIKQGIVELNQGLSLDVLATFPDHYFDFIYVDTGHSYDLTLAELRLCVKKVRPRGVIGGHDFCAGNVVAPYVYGVIQAVNLFCIENQWRHKYISLETNGFFSFCLERIPQ